MEMDKKAFLLLLVQIEEPVTHSLAPSLRLIGVASSGRIGSRIARARRILLMQVLAAAALLYVFDEGGACTTSRRRRRYITVDVRI